MQTIIAPTQREPPALSDHDDRSRRRAVLWSYAITLVTILLVLVAMLRRTHGHLVYVMDDPAIHLAVAHDLAWHGTWGISPGDFESASSSPLWTLLLTPFALLPRPLFEVVPLLVNIGAALWIARLIVTRTPFLQPGRHRLAPLAALFVILIGVLFLPGLVMVGMEHTLHIALVLQALVWLQSWLETGDARTWRRVLIVLFLAGATRLETAFVAAGIAVGLLILALPPLRTRTGVGLWEQLRRAVMVAVASLAPAVLYAAVNLAMGQDALPNSVVAKSALGGGTSGIRVTLGATLDALAKDPVVLVGAVLALAYCVAACFGGPRRYFVLAATVVVTSVLHSALATYGWFERYQAYLVAMVVLFVLLAAQECVPVRLSRAVPVMLIIAGIVLAPAKWALLAKTPAAAADTYLQRYQAARFVERYYPGQPVATGEVGYIGLRHDGPLLDVLGLANHEVLAARRDNRDNSQFWTDIVRKSGAHVVIVYPLSLLYDTPKQWILVGELTLHQTTVTAYEPTLQFWAPDVADVDRLRADMLDFRSQLPAGVTLDINQFVDIRKSQELSRAGTG